MSDAMTKVSKEAPCIAKRLSDDINQIAGEPVAFSLFIWTEGRCSYISSATDRAEIIAVLESMIAGWKEGMPDIPAHEVS